MQCRMWKCLWPSNTFFSLIIFFSFFILKINIITYSHLLSFIINVCIQSLYDILQWKLVLWNDCSFCQMMLNYSINLLHDDFERCRCWQIKEEKNETFTWLRLLPSFKTRKLPVFHFLTRMNVMCFLIREMLFLRRTRFRILLHLKTQKYDLLSVENTIVCLYFYLNYKKMLESLCIMKCFMFLNPL